MVGFKIENTLNGFGARGPCEVTDDYLTIEAFGRYTWSDGVIRAASSKV